MFSWKNEIFFDILGFHLLFSAVTLILVAFFYFFQREFIGILDAIFALTTIIFSIFFFLHTKKFREEFVYSFLISILAAASILFLFFWPEMPIQVFFGMLAMVSAGIFEMSEKSTFFEKFRLLARIFFLSMTVVFTVILMILMLFIFDSIYFLLPIIAFCFSVHMRFFNVVCYVLGIFATYWVYGVTFFSFISAESVFSTLLYIYLLPLLIIGNTYFWEERQKYDFAIIHYSSIAFSLIFFLYCLLLI